jgi:hypothetical protein
MAFTEQGVAMLSSVLKSERAIEVNVAIMRVFVQIRQMLATHKDLKARELATCGVDMSEMVRRNIERFPDDFMFRLTKGEHDHLRSQFATPSDGPGHGGRRTLPFVFTEHGAIMAATVLNSKQAVEVSIFVVRAFVKLRQMLAAHKDLEKKIEEMESKYDEQFRVVFDAIRQLLVEDEKPKQKIGF